jgi:hypothetical protein
MVFRYGWFVGLRVGVLHILLVGLLSLSGTMKQVPPTKRRQVTQTCHLHTSIELTFPRHSPPSPMMTSLGKMLGQKSDNTSPTSNHPYYLFEWQKTAAGHSPPLVTNPASTCGVREVLVRQLLDFFTTKLIKILTQIIPGKSQRKQYALQRYKIA